MVIAVRRWSWYRVVLVAAFAICGDRPAPTPAQTRVDTVGGVVHVWNSSSGAWGRDVPWSVAEILRIGAPSGPPEELFSGPLLTTALGTNGSIYVLDSDADQITVFDTLGTFVRRVGGPGQGPGEFAAPSAMTWDGYGRLWVANGFDGRYSIFTSDGGFVRTERRPTHAISRRQHRLVYRNGGAIVDEAPRWPTVWFLSVDTAGGRVDTLGALQQPTLSRAVLDVRIPPGGKFQQFVRSYLRRNHWTLGSDGSLWMVESGELRLVQRALDGDTIRVVHTEHRRRDLTRAERRMVRAALAEVDLDRGDVEVVRPIVQGIHVLDDGHVLVQIEEEVGEDSSVFDVFSPQGVFLGTLDFGFAPAPTGVMTFHGDTILAPTLGAWDVPYVVRAVIRRGHG